MNSGFVVTQVRYFNAIGVQSDDCGLNDSGEALELTLVTQAISEDIFAKYDSSEIRHAELDVKCVDCPLENCDWADTAIFTREGDLIFMS